MYLYEDILKFIKKQQKNQNDEQHKLNVIF